ncbi:hypothetical protein K474DRAFT_1681985 [Panus rudis PR-1116 ss-1]|nr:hypothetical protein K474DRAFT_1681985 [Panus rudis PR-1116 ss-1]
MASPAAVTYGPIFIGMVFNILLYGIMITQTFLYFNTYKNDKLWMKFFVGFLFVCDTANCAFDITFVYTALITEFGDDNALQFASWDPAMTAIIALCVQLFFAWRMKVLTGSYLAVVAVAGCSIAQWCGGIGTAIAVRIVPKFVEFQKFQVIVIIWLAFSAVADVGITIALVWHLRKHKTGFSATDDIVNKIIRLTVQTGLITALCATTDLILFLASPSGLHLIFNLPLSKLYTNSLMSSLNSRAGWKYGASIGKNISPDVESSRALLDRGTHAQAYRVSQPSQRVYIDVESHEMVDRVGDTKLEKDIPGVVSTSGSGSEFKD